MGNALFDHRLITSHHIYEDYKACATDADCFGANGDWPAVTSKEAQGFRCCMRIEIRRKGPSEAARESRDLMLLVNGWPT